MTHPTDEELDKLVEQQTRAANKRDEFEALMNADRTVRAITALRAQLAEARTELVRRVDMHECAMAERDDATLYSDEQKARADRAEAALAALEHAPRVSETPKSEHDRADVLTAVPAPVTPAEAAKVLLADKAALATLVDVAEEEHDKGVSFGVVIGRALRAIEEGESK